MKNITGVVHDELYKKLQNHIHNEIELNIDENLIHYSEIKWIEIEEEIKLNLGMEINSEIINEIR